MWRPKALLVSAQVGLAAVIVAAACGGNEGQPTVGCSGGSIDVVVTLPVFADFACQVGGERVTVTALIPPGADPHTYQPAPEDAERIRDARLILYNGLALDEPAVDFIFQHARGSVQIISYALSLSSPTAEQPPPDQIPITAQEAGDNPHLWLDVEVAKVYISSTRNSLEIVDADGIPTYRQNANTYISELDALHREVQQAVQSIPQERRKLVTFHDSFPHFARQYGLELLGPIAPDTEREPTPEELDTLAQEIEDAGIPSLFAERGFDASMVERVAQEAGVRVCALYSDILDKDADTYVEMMRANAQEMVNCLGEEAGP